MDSKPCEYFDGVHFEPRFFNIKIVENQIFLEYPNEISLILFIEDVTHFQKIGDKLLLEFKTKAHSPSKESLIIWDLKSQNDFFLFKKNKQNSLTSLLFPHQFSGKNLLILLSIAALLLASIYLIFNHLYSFTPKQYDEYLGSKFHNQISSTLEFCQNQELNSFVQKSVKTLHLPQDQFHYQYHIVNAPMENAFAIPGGHIYVFSGLIQNSQSPDEVIGVLAHEIEHVENRHSVQQMQKVLGRSLLISLVTGGFMDGIDALQNAATIGDIANGFLFLKHSQLFEEQADKKAIFRLNQNQMSVQGMIDFFEKHVQKESKDTSFWNRSTDYLSTHPSTHKRIGYLKNALKKESFSPNSSFAQERKNWNSLKLKCPLEAKQEWWENLIDHSKK